MKAETVAGALSAEFTNGEVLTFEGRGGRTFDYIEDETVMDRLDAVLGIGSWSVRVEPISVADGIVKVTLEAIVEGKGVVFEDFGYATRTDGEALKEAVSDGIRRTGRFLGVARYLYKKHETQRNGRGPSSPRPSANDGNGRDVPQRTRPSVVDDDDGPTETDAVRELFARPEPRPGDICPDHGEAWKGTVGDLYHGPKGIVAGGWCHPAGQAKKARAR